MGDVPHREFLQSVPNFLFGQVERAKIQQHLFRLRGFRGP